MFPLIFKLNKTLVINHIKQYLSKYTANVLYMLQWFYGVWIKGCKTFSQNNYDNY